MRIGLDISQAIYGTGVSDYTLDLAHALVSTDPTNQYAYFGSSLRRSKDLQRLFPTSRIYPFPPMFLHLLWNRLHIINIENFIGSIDVYHSSDWTQAPSSAAKVTTVHDLSPFLYPDEMASGAFRNISSVHKHKMSWSVRECQKIICVSEATASDLQQVFKYPSSKIEIIPEALPTRFRFKPTKKEVSQVQSKYNLKNYVLTIGTPQPRKNISSLVKAFLKYQSRYRLPDQLVIVGGHGWGITDIPDDPRVVFTGYLQDKEVAALTSGAQVFAFTSLYEGFGLPILIAFHHHVPVVTSNTSSMPEVAGSAAVLVDPVDLESMASGMSQAIKNRKKLISSGTTQLAKFSWENTAKKTLMLYSQLC